MEQIPLIEVQDLNELCNKEQDKAYKLIKDIKRTYGAISDGATDLLFPLADMLAKKWLAKSNSPYQEEIADFWDSLRVPGVYFLNLCYEFGCTSGCFQEESAPYLLRTLDWPFKGLGENICVVKQQGEVGLFYNVTWPTLSVVYQAMAPSRFAATINQAPMRKHGLTFVGDWFKNRALVNKETAIPPSHLLRQVFETAVDYSQAKQLLIETPICIPVIYTLAGVNKGEACIIERLENKAVVKEIGTDNLVTTANHFETKLDKEGLGWLPREIDSKGRKKQIDSIEVADLEDDSFDYLDFPIINKRTRLCFLTNVANSSLKVQGFAGEKNVTEIFNLS